jgi:hypothetical protein
MEPAPPLSAGHRFASIRAAIATVLLAGMLSMLFAGIFSGSSVLWFLQAGAYLLTFPLYLSHLLLFLNLAFPLPADFALLALPLGCPFRAL